LVQARDAVQERGGCPAAGYSSDDGAGDCAIADALVAGKAPEATRKQAMDLQGAILAALRKREGTTVVSEGAPARWRLKEAAN
jgi:hypothetical protein